MNEDMKVNTPRDLRICNGQIREYIVGKLNHLIAGKLVNSINILRESYIGQWPGVFQFLCSRCQYGFCVDIQSHLIWHNLSTDALHLHDATHVTLMAYLTSIKCRCGFRKVLESQFITQIHLRTTLSESLTTVLLTTTRFCHNEILT